MDSLITPVVSAAKLAILNPNEFDIWKMRIEQYFLMTDYSLWEVIINGDSPASTVVVDGVVGPVTIFSADQKLARRNELKARGTLLMALPDKHQLKFNFHKDANTLIEAIEKRFEGNTKTKKVQKTLLKQQFENFTGSSSKNLNQIHDRLQKLTHALIWRNKADLEEHSLDDLFNSLRIYEAKVKHSSTPDNPTQNLAFVSSSNTDSTTDSSTSPQLDNEDLKQIDVDDLEEMDLRWQMAMLTLRARRFLQKTERNLGDNRVTTIGFDMSKVECYNCHRKGHFARECRSPKDIRRNGTAELQRKTALVETSTSNSLASQCDGIGSYDWSYQAEEEPTNFTLMAITSSSSSSNNETNDKQGLGYFSSETNSESLSHSCPSDRLPHSGGYNAVPPPITGNFMPPKPDLGASSFVQTFEHVKPSGHSVQLVKAPILAATPKPTSPKTNYSGKRKNRKTCFMCRSMDHLIKDCTFYTKPKTQPTPRNYVHRGYIKQHALFTKNYPLKHIVPAPVLTKSKPVSVTAVRPVSAPVPKIMVTRPRHAHSLNTKSNSTIRRHITCSQSPKTNNSPPKVTAAKAQVSNDVTRLQALVDKKKMVVTEATIKDALHLDDAEGVDCFPNEEFLLNWLAWVMRSRLQSWHSIRLSSQASGSRKFNFSKYIFDSFVRNVDSSSKFYMYPRRVGKGCSGVKTPLFKGMLVAREPEEQSDTEEQGNADNAAEEPVAQNLEITKLKTRVKKLERSNKVKTLKLRRLRKVGTSQRVNTLDDTLMKDVSNQGRIIDDLDKYDGAVLMSEKDEKEAEEVKDITGRKFNFSKYIFDSFVRNVDSSSKFYMYPRRVGKGCSGVKTPLFKGMLVAREPEEQSDTKEQEVIAAVSETVSVAAVVPTVTAAVVPTVTAASVKVDVPSIRQKREVERFSISKPNNFSDDFLLTTLRAMFERPDGQDQVWMSQTSVHGQAKVKTWKLLESCGVHIVALTTTQLIILIERRYPLLRFTLDQMLNAVRLRVEEQSEMSLELIRFTRKQLQEGQHN
nr:hypothetical protein [Tanacetum cinerariifolium]